MDHGISIEEEVSASKKLSENEAKSLLKAASTLIVAKGKKVNESPIGSRVSKELVSTMLGPTGNLRAPTLVFGKTVLVGFNEDVYKTYLT